MRLGKRIFDVSVAAIALIFTAPFSLAAALMIRVTMGTPVLFRQQRPGLHGRPFQLLKFRTMTVAEDQDDAIRLTPVGRLLRRWSIDEIPQLFNVLRGDMSLVGPRPLLVEYIPLYSERQAKRHEVLPGITGWAQINGRNAVSWRDKLEMDVWYVEHQSFTLDLRILLLTARAVLGGRGVSQEGHATAAKFTGNLND